MKVIDLLKIADPAMTIDLVWGENGENYVYDEAKNIIDEAKQSRWINLLSVLEIKKLSVYGICDATEESENLLQIPITIGLTIEAQIPKSKLEEE